MSKVVDRLLSVKSIISLALTVTFSILALTDRISPEDVLRVYLLVIAFYFGTQANKGTGGAGGVNNNNQGGKADEHSQNQRSS